MGTKRSILTDEKGLTLAVVISGANTQGIKLLRKTLAHIVVPRPKPDKKHPQNLCLDAGYTGNGKAVEQWWRYIVHIRPRGEEKKEWQRNPDFRARRWVVEVTHPFFNRFRKLLVRYEKRLKTIWPYSNLPAPLLFGVSLFSFIVNFKIGS